MKQPKLEIRANAIRVSPLCDIEVLPPEQRWEPGNFRGSGGENGNKFLRYIESKDPGLKPHGWKDITPYWGKVWPQSLSAWRTQAAKHGYYVSVKVITKIGEEPYRGIFVCLLGEE